MTTNTIGVDAHPLTWPLGRARTSSYSRKRAKFAATFAVARDSVLSEVRRAGGRSAVISTNVALRRDGQELADAAFSGFTALPPAPSSAPPRKWWEVLEVFQSTSADLVAAAYRRLSLIRHPDRGGTHEKMAELNNAYDQFRKERGV